MEGYTVALFLNKDEDKKNIYLYFYDSFSKEINNDCLLIDGEGLIGWVYRQQKTLIANNYERKTSTLKIYKKDENIKSLIVTPLPEKKGILYVDSKKSYSFTENKEKIFKQISFLIYKNLLKNYNIKKISNELTKSNLEIDIDNMIIYHKCSYKKIVEKLMNNIFTFFDLYLNISFYNDSIFFLDKHSFKYLKSSNFIKGTSLINIIIKNKKTVFRNSIKSKNQLSTKI